MVGNATPAPISKGNEYKIEEWKNLREEIARKQQLNYQILFYTLGFNFLLYSYILVDNTRYDWTDACVALLPAFSAGVAHYWHLRNEHSALRITIYLRFFIETMETHSFQWETTLRGFIDKKISEKREVLKQKPKQLEHLNQSKSGLSKVLTPMKVAWRFLARTSKSLWVYLKKTFNFSKAPREVKLLLNPFYIISPIVSTFILFQSDKIQGKIYHGFENWIFGHTVHASIVFLIISIIIYLICERTMIRIGNKEIDILRLVSADIESKPQHLWKKEVNDWKNMNLSSP